MNVGCPTYYTLIRHKGNTADLGLELRLLEVPIASKIPADGTKWRMDHLEHSLPEGGETHPHVPACISLFTFCTTTSFILHHFNFLRRTVTNSTLRANHERAERAICIDTKIPIAFSESEHWPATSY